MKRPAHLEHTFLGQFLRVEILSGIVLLGATIAAFLWANSPWRSTYEQLWQLTPLPGSGSLMFWVSDGLMTIFFLLVGLEIRREMHEGTLTNLRVAALPVAAALGGIIAPALLFLSINHGSAFTQGWAIPTATDIAFAVGLLALLGARVAPAMRAFLLAIAVIDDLVAIVVIAVAYSEGLDPVGLIILAVAAGGLFMLLKVSTRYLSVRLLLGAVAWYGLLKSGTHPALAGVLLGLMMPMELLRPLEHRLHPWVAFGIMPLYAFANAGIRVDGISTALDAAGPLLLGVAGGLVLGKPLGITLATWLSTRAGWCELPQDVDFRHVLVVGCIAGMGFTMSIFISHLAFEGDLLSVAKFAVLTGSVVAAALGLVCGRLLLRINAVT